MKKKRGYFTNGANASFPFSPDPLLEKSEETEVIIKADCAEEDERNKEAGRLLKLILTVKRENKSQDSGILDIKNTLLISEGGPLF